tara:strand:+ start:448 stop:648 length:201 start_codon:yes stop_codon:yes gene_type:complete
MRVSETQYRQEKLDKKIKRFIDGWYNNYYTDTAGSLVVFVKDYKNHSTKHCVNIDGLVFILAIKNE